MAEQVCPPNYHSRPRWKEIVNSANFFEKLHDIKDIECSSPFRIFHKYSSDMGHDARHGAMVMPCPGFFVFSAVNRSKPNYDKETVR